MTAASFGHERAKPDTGGAVRRRVLCGLVPLLCAIALLAGAGSAQAAGSLRASPFAAGGGAPTVTGLSPNHGWSTGEQWILLEGTNLEEITGVEVGDQEAGYRELEAGEMFVIIPPEDKAGIEAGGKVRITVTTEFGTSGPAPSGEDIFTYTEPVEPYVSEVVPGAGPLAGGTVVSIHGAGFRESEEGEAVVTGVKFGSKPAASYEVKGPGTIWATSPPETAGTVNVRVQTRAGTSPVSSGDRFEYRAAPAVTAVVPGEGSAAGGNSVEIRGTGLREAETVKFGAQTASFTTKENNAILATAPPGSGTVDVTVATPYGTSTPSGVDHYKYIPLAPTVTGVAPPSGSEAGGTHVTLTGSGFDTAESVTFGGSSASIVEVVSASEMVVAAPAGSGTVDVRVTGPGGSSTAGPADRYTYNPTTEPVIIHVSPEPGEIGCCEKQVTLTGRNLAGATVTTPVWTSAGMTERELEVTEDTAESLRFFADPGPLYVEDPGVQAFTVRTPDGTASTQLAFLPPVESYPEIGNCSALAAKLGGFRDSKCAKNEPAHHGKYEFTPGVAGGTVTFSAGAVGIGAITCASVTGSGTVSVPDQIGGVTLTFNGCTHSELGSCSNTATAGEIGSMPLVGWFGWHPKKGSGKKEAMLELLPYALHGAFAHFQCGGHNITLTHGVGALIKAAKPSASLAIPFTVKKGRPPVGETRWGVWGAGTEFSEDAEGAQFGPFEVPLTGTLTLSASSPFEVDPAT